MSTIAERVAKGAEWLDEREPGWDARIDLGQLDMIDSCHCVLGQVFEALATPDDDYDNGFDYAINALDVPDVEYGFNIPIWEAGAYVEVAESRRRFTVLGTEWKRLIAERRSSS